jgi:hypothetical protein
MRGLFLSILISAAVGLAMPVEAQDQPSLEELEQMGEELDQQPAAKSAPASPIAPHPGQPALDTSGLEAVDIRSQIRKVMEANLFAGVPPLPGTLRNMAMGEAPEEYLVQEGDNLYDICDQLLDEPDYWPKLWSLNPDIANPHFVYPGMKLRFYAGDAENPPFLQVVTEDDIVPVNKGGVVEAELVQEDISGMLMRSELPENLEVLDASQLEPMPGIDDMFMSGGGVLQGVDTRLIVPAFIVDEEFEELGAVVGGSAGNFLLDKGQDVIIEEEEAMQIGTTYTVVRASGKIYNRSDDDFIGYRYEFIAQVKIDARDEDAGVYKAKVVYNRLGVQPGDLVIPFRSVRRTVPIEVQTPTPGAGQEVVAFTEPFMEVGGRGAFVFLSQLDTKLQASQTYTLVQNVKVASPIFLQDALPDTVHKVAKVYILDASGSVALGYIVNDAFEVRLGDRVSP